MPARVQLRKGSKAETKENVRQKKNIFCLRSHATQVTFKGGRITMSFQNPRSVKKHRSLLLKG